MRKKLPIGIENFEEFSAENFYYVDKTLFIKELLQNWGKVNLFTRPRRFGKSLNMSMLKSFFEAGSDPALFDGLKIMEEKELCEKYMGKFPVISVSLKGVDGLSFESASAALRTVIGNEARRFGFLRESAALDQVDKDSYQRLIKVGTGTRALYDMTDDVAAASLKTLSQLLARHYNQKVILLIDEYDVPLDKAFQSGYYDEMVSLIRNLLGNALKTNDSLYFAVLTGCLLAVAPSPLGSEVPRQVDEVGFPAKLENTSLSSQCQSIFTGLNNLKVHTVSDVRYDEFFGFTDGDVDELLADPGAEPKNYWANTSGNNLIRRMLKNAALTTKDEVEELLNGEAITKNIKHELTYGEIDDSVENVWSVLYSTGYLTGEHVAGADAELFRLWLPNGEIRRLFAGLAQDWFRETTRSDSARINRFCAAFPAGDVAVVEEMLNDYLWDSISVRDTAVRANMKENFYHGMLLGLLRSQGSWLVKSNAETGEGYSDISIRTPDRMGIVIELKYAEHGNLEMACQKALDQIEEKKYAQGLKRRGAKKIIKYGIAFYEKECMVRMA